jgi:5-methylcytosine-specific restriction enzyme A
VPRRAGRVRGKSTSPPGRVSGDPPRGTTAERGYGYAWQKARRQFLALNPLCVECRELGVMTPAAHVDHRVPHRGDMVLFWDQGNWQALCVRHHNQKSAREGEKPRGVSRAPHPKAPSPGHASGFAAARGREAGRPVSPAAHPRES